MSGIPFIRSQNVHLNKFSDEGLAHISREQDAAMENSRVQQGDVLLNITGASIGRVCVVPRRLCPGNVNQHVSIIRCKADIQPEWLSYFISTGPFQNSMLNMQAGATRQALTKTLIEDFRIPLPPLPEQKRMTAILNEQMEAVERAREATEVQLKAASRLAEAYITTAFTRQNAQLWEKRRLSELCNLLPSKSIATDGDQAVDAVTTACLCETGFDPVGIKKARMWAKDAAQCRLAPGEVLVARSNTPELVGRAALYTGHPTGIVASDLTIRIAVKNALLPGYLAGYLSFLFVTGYWKERAGGASGSMKKITRGQILDQKIPVPDRHVQRQVVSDLTEKLGGVVGTKTALTKQRQLVSELPAAFLRQAFNGGL
jgi:type I restriction enzyme S subunit